MSPKQVNSNSVYGLARIGPTKNIRKHRTDCYTIGAVNVKRGVAWRLGHVA